MLTKYTEIQKPYEAYSYIVEQKNLRIHTSNEWLIRCWEYNMLKNVVRFKRIENFHLRIDKGFLYLRIKSMALSKIYIYIYIYKEIEKITFI